MNTEPPYAGLKWAHYLRAMILVPLDQGTQGNKGRKGISLDFKRVSGKNSKILWALEFFIFILNHLEGKTALTIRKINDLITLTHYDICITYSDIMGIVNMIWALIKSTIPGLNVPE